MSAVQRAGDTPASRPAARPAAPRTRPTSGRTMASRRRNQAARSYVILMGLVVIFGGPFAWIVLTSLKTMAELRAFDPQLLPVAAQWHNFVDALTQINFTAYAMNSLFLSTMYATLITISSALVGFGFARLRGPGKKVLFLVLLATMMLPSILTVIPTYILFSRLGLVNTYWPWFLWGLAASPYLVFMFRQFFGAIPPELDEAAIIDGCGYGRIFFSIFLPLSRPVLVTAFLLSFIWNWGDFLAPSLLLDVDHTTLAVAISTRYIDQHANTIIPLQSAGALIYILPVMLIFLFAQRYFIRSVVSSSVKG